MGENEERMLVDAVDMASTLPRGRALQQQLCRSDNTCRAKAVEQVLCKRRSERVIVIRKTEQPSLHNGSVAVAARARKHADATRVDNFWIRPSCKQRQDNSKGIGLLCAPNHGKMEGAAPAAQRAERIVDLAPAMQLLLAL